MLSYFNRRHKRIGHVFHGRYKAILCDADAYLLELVRYIHLNPVRAGLTVTPQSYLWSSHKDYLGDLRESIVDTKHILPQFGSTHIKAKQRFAAFVLERLHDGKREDFYRTIDQRFLGDDEFIEAIKDTIGEFAMEKAMRGVSCSTDLKGLLSLVAGRVDLSESDILGPTQQRTATFARHIFIYLAQEVFDFTNRKIAAYLRRDASCISHATQKTKACLLTDERVKVMVDELSRQCIT